MYQFLGLTSVINISWQKTKLFFLNKCEDEGPAILEVFSNATGRPIEEVRCPVEGFVFATEALGVGSHHWTLWFGDAELAWCCCLAKHNPGYNIHALFIIYRIFFCWKGTATTEDSWQIASELLAEMKLLWPWEGHGTGGTDGQMDGVDMARCLFFLKIHFPKLNISHLKKEISFKTKGSFFQAPFLRGYICSFFLVSSSGFTSRNVGGGCESWIHLASENHLSLMFNVKC